MEGDTLIVKGHKQVFASLAECKTCYALLHKVSRKTSVFAGSAIIECLKPISKHFRIITYDNGREFSDHDKIDKSLNSTCYFDDPFSS